MVQEGCKKDILNHLRANRNTEFESYQLGKIFNLSQTTVNGYLTDLETDSKIQRRKKGYWVYWKARSELTIAQRVMSKKWDGDLFDIDLKRIIALQ